jgi:enoyl-[acyl-carrier protein] reductase III
VIALEGQVALVTGASRGIGRAVALRLAEAGADVVVTYLTSRRAALDVAGAVQACGRRSAVVRADVGEKRDVAALVRFVGERFGRLDVLVSNVASGGFRPLLETTRRQRALAMDVNVWALVELARESRTLFRRGGGRARIVALSSHGAHRPLPGYGLVGASKAALESVVRQLALELGPAGVNVNAVLAGLVETDSTRELPGARELFAAARERSLVARALSARDVADAVLFLASPLADQVQGQTLVVDGGTGLRG